MDCDQKRVIFLDIQIVAQEDIDTWFQINFRRHLRLTLFYILQVPIPDLQSIVYLVGKPRQSLRKAIEDLIFFPATTDAEKKIPQYPHQHSQFLLWSRPRRENTVKIARGQACICVPTVSHDIRGWVDPGMQECRVECAVLSPPPLRMVCTRSVAHPPGPCMQQAVGSSQRSVAIFKE